MLFLLEGMDKTGKSTVAELLRRKFKCDYMHMSAPAKWHTRESYLGEMLHTIALTAGKNVVIDRTWYGELVWPGVYGREALLSKGDVDLLTAAACVLHKSQVQLIYMYDFNPAAHKVRLSEFKEPTYNYEATSSAYEKMAQGNDFDFITFQEAVKKWN